MENNLKHTIMKELICVIHNKEQVLRYTNPVKGIFKIVSKQKDYRDFENSVVYFPFDFDLDEGDIINEISIKFVEQFLNPETELWQWNNIHCGNDPEIRLACVLKSNL